MRPELEPIIDALRESYCTKRVDDLSRDVTDTAATEAFALGTNTELTAYTTPETVCKLPNRNRSTNEPESADLSKTPGLNFASLGGNGTSGGDFCLETESVDIEDIELDHD
ncbi:hypothetical protein ETB97_009789 [Aspergillus alliaceus]|uniref:Uncharacterized protein n=1 Tax=Petromyces alliaceus TaxID=209559 RepID=A0A8H6AAL3_PETAA|nr:hypothetical protein ETB97_009789 [Aspergillus burnettii]